MYVPQDKIDYVGIWKGDGVTLIIAQNGRVHYERMGNGGDVSIKAPLNAFTSDGFQVGVLFFKTNFKVNMPPHMENNVWMMTLDGRVLTKTNSIASPIIANDTEEASSHASTKTVPPLHMLEKLIDSTLHDFSLSVKHADFSYLYDHISKIWKAQTSKEKFHQIFKSFIDQKIGVDNLIQKQPVLNEQPTIDKDGFLTLSGYYPSPNNTILFFDLDYTYEYPNWVLSRIKINVK